MRIFLNSIRQTVSVCRPALSFLIVALMVSLPLITSAQDGVEGAAPQVRAKEFAFYGTNRADWAVLTTPDIDGQPFVWKIIKNPASPAPGAAQISI